MGLVDLRYVGYCLRDTGNANRVQWEKLHGRPCLPPLLLHPVKNTEQTKPKFATKYDFP